MKLPQLFLLHFAGGNKYSFKFLFPHLQDFSIIAIELPGRGDRINEVFKKDMMAAAKDIFDQITKRLGNSGFIIYGHSLGAILGLVVTGMLEKINKSPSYLFVSGHEGPTTLNKKRYVMDDGNLIEELTKLGGIPIEILQNKEFLNFYLPIVRADFEIADKKSYSITPVNVPIYAMMGSEEEGVERISNWQNYTQADFKFKIFNGGHFFIYDYPEKLKDIITNTFFGESY